MTTVAEHRGAVRLAMRDTLTQYITDELEGKHEGACVLLSMLTTELDTFSRSEILRALDDAHADGLLVVEGADIDVIITLCESRAEAVA